MKKLFVGTVCAAGLSLLAVNAFAKDGRGDPFERLDANGDGYVTAEELSDKGAKLMEEADANNDGRLSRDEMKAHHENRKKEHDADSNDDGVVDRTEFLAKAQERFDALDKNQDGVLSKDEMPRRKFRRGHR